MLSFVCSLVWDREDGRVPTLPLRGPFQARALRYLCYTETTSRCFEREERRDRATEAWRAQKGAEKTLDLNGDSRRPRRTA